MSEVVFDRGAADGSGQYGESRSDIFAFESPACRVVVEKRDADESSRLEGGAERNGEVPFLYLAECYRGDAHAFGKFFNCPVAFLARCSNPISE